MKKASVIAITLASLILPIYPAQGASVTGKLIAEAMSFPYGPLASAYTMLLNRQVPTFHEESRWELRAEIPADSRANGPSVRLHYNLFDGGLRKQTANARKLEFEEAQVDFVDRARRILGNIFSNYLYVDTSTRIIETYQDAITLLDSDGYAGTERIVLSNRLQREVINRKRALRILAENGITHDSPLGLEPLENHVAGSTPETRWAAIQNHPRLLSHRLSRIQDELRAGSNNPLFNIDLGMGYAPSVTRDGVERPEFHWDISITIMPPATNSIRTYFSGRIEDDRSTGTFFVHAPEREERGVLPFPRDPSYDRRLWEEVEELLAELDLLSDEIEFAKMTLDARESTFSRTPSPAALVAAVDALVWHSWATHEYNEKLVRIFIELAGYDEAITAIIKGGYL